MNKRRTLRISRSDPFQRSLKRIIIRRNALAARLDLTVGSRGEKGTTLKPIGAGNCRVHWGSSRNGTNSLLLLFPYPSLSILLWIGILEVRFLSCFPCSARNLMYFGSKRNILPRPSAHLSSKNSLDMYWAERFTFYSRRNLGRILSCSSKPLWIRLSH